MTVDEKQRKAERILFSGKSFVEYDINIDALQRRTYPVTRSPEPDIIKSGNKLHITWKRNPLLMEDMIADVKRLPGREWLEPPVKINEVDIDLAVIDFAEKYGLLLDEEARRAIIERETMDNFIVTPDFIKSVIDFGVEAEGCFVFESPQKRQDIAIAVLEKMGAFPCLVATPEPSSWPGRAGLVIVQDDLLGDKLEELQGGFKGVILDDIHRYKNERTPRSEAMAQIVEFLPQDAVRIGIMGVAKVERSSEWLNSLLLIDRLRDVVPTFTLPKSGPINTQDYIQGFLWRYCGPKKTADVSDPRGKWIYLGNSNTLEFYNQMTENCYISPTSWEDARVGGLEHSMK